MHVYQKHFSRSRRRRQVGDRIRVVDVQSEDDEEDLSHGARMVLEVRSRLQARRVSRQRSVAERRAAEATRRRGNHHEHRRTTGARRRRVSADRRQHQLAHRSRRAVGTEGRCAGAIREGTDREKGRKHQTAAV